MNKKIIKIVAWLIFSSIVIAGAIIFNVFNKPHRNVQQTKVFAEISIKDLLNEFSSDAVKANAKYLSVDGNSKVLAVIGTVHSITTNQKKEKVVLLKEGGSKMGVSCTFTQETSPHTEILKIKDIVKIKGAITAGNAYDPDLDLYNHAVLVQCDVMK